MLRVRLPQLGWNGAVVEQEYQKRIPDHGFRIRPDIIVHVPYEPSIHSSRMEGNFVVFELKLQAGPKQAAEVYEKLCNMCDVLGYPLAIFINISAEDTHFENYKGPYKDRILAISARLDNGLPLINEQRAT